MARKFKDDQIEDIFIRFYRDKITKVKIADIYDCDRGSIIDILNKKAMYLRQPGRLMENILNIEKLYKDKLSQKTGGK